MPTRSSTISLGLLLGIILLMTACKDEAELGYLHVTAPDNGHFDIYRVASEEPVQFVAERAGQFNEPVALEPGRYLVLADCSSNDIIIRANQTQELVAHRVEFQPPRKPQAEDRFSIQCSQSSMTKSRQSIEGRFALNMLHGRWDLLVGMIPWSVDFGSQQNVTVEPTRRQIPLAALQVAAEKTIDRDETYFISPSDQLIAVTTSIPFGRWAYLMPGRYAVEVNGTDNEIELTANEERVIRPAFLKVTTPPDADLELAMRIMGTPQLVEINSGHWLDFNFMYPVLPGPANVRISGSTRAVTVMLEEDKEHILPSHGVTIELDCSPWDWTCLGQKTIILYVDGQAYPFKESFSDISVLFFNKQEEDILVGIEGSRDIRYRLKSNREKQSLGIGYVRMVPQPTSRAGQVTDLVRVEAVEKSRATGYTLDIDLEKPTTMPLIAGWYYLAHYVTLTAVEGDRRRTRRGFRVKAGETIDLPFPVFFSDKRLEKYQAEQKAKEEKETVATPSPVYVPGRTTELEYL